jgi:hypothetical protein
MQNEVLEDIRRKERVLKGLDKEINRSGLMIFEDYESKLNMMNTQLFLFGMKLHRQHGSLEFFDADLCNNLQVSADVFIDKPLYDCCQLINELLSR